MPTDAQMRDDIQRVYPYRAWSEKVKRMSPNQVYSVWMRLVGSKKR